MSFRKNSAKGDIGLNTGPHVKGTIQLFLNGQHIGPYDVLHKDVISGLSAITKTVIFRPVMSRSQKIEMTPATMRVLSYSKYSRNA